MRLNSVIARRHNYIFHAIRSLMSVDLMLCRRTTYCRNSFNAHFHSSALQNFSIGSFFLEWSRELRASRSIKWRVIFDGSALSRESNLNSHRQRNDLSFVYLSKGAAVNECYRSVESRFDVCSGKSLVSAVGL